MQRLHDKQTRKWLSPYIREMADRMGLTDWRFEFIFYPPTDDDCFAEITPDDGKQSATIRFNADFPTYDREQQRETVVHELIHCHLDLIQQQIRNDLPKLLGQPSYDAFWPSFVRGLERGVDGLTQAWAPLMPLPPEND